MPTFHLPTREKDDDVSEELVAQADEQVTSRDVGMCPPDLPKWQPGPLLDREAGYGERVAAVDDTWSGGLTCDAILQTGPDGELLVAAETDEPPSDGMWRCEDEAEFQVVFGPETNPEGGTGVRLRCIDCADSAVAAFGLGQVRLLAL